MFGQIARRGAEAALAWLLLGTAMPAHPAPDPALPLPVGAALDRAHVPRQALVAVVQEVGGAPALSWQADLSVNPASLMKLVTTFAGLELLGPAWTWSTPVWLQGEVRDGVLHGNLVIRGSGDPTLVVERVWLMLRRVQELGVHEIAGDIVIDRSAFEPAAQSPAEFDGDPLRPYNVGADALLINHGSVTYTFTPDAAHGIARVGTDMPLAGVAVPPSLPLSRAACADWRAGVGADFSDPSRVRFTGDYPSSCGVKVWAVAYADPPSYAARALLGIWQGLGGRLSGRVRDGAAARTAPGFEWVSPPLAEVIRDINKYSNNVMAQQLFLTLGSRQGGAGTSPAARQVVQDWAHARWGAAATALVVDNGSGLSRQSRISAALLAQLLQTAWASPWMPELMASLPVSGVDGTLKRFRGGPAGSAHLKTGSLRDVAGIAGYVLSDAGPRYVVVAIVNDPGADAARPALEALVDWVAHGGARAAAPVASSAPNGVPP